VSCFGTFRRRCLVSRTSSATIESIDTICRFSRRPAIRCRPTRGQVFRLLLMTLRRWSLCFPVSNCCLSSKLLSLGRMLVVQRSRFAVDTVVYLGDFAAVIVAFDVLPGITTLTEDGVSVVLLKVADTFDGVGLIFLWQH
jgi:hypothetical protein